MIHYDSNVKKVLDTFELFGYDSGTIDRQRMYYKELKAAMLKGKDTAAFSLDQAFLLYPEGSNTQKGKRMVSAILRLSDVYETGKVRAKHLPFSFELALNLEQSIDKYLSSEQLQSCRQHVILYVIKPALTQFCKYAQYNGACSVEEISYEQVLLYHSFLEGSVDVYRQKEELIGDFLDYFDNGMTNRFTLFTHYLHNGKQFYLGALPSEQQTLIEERRSDSLFFPADEFYATIADFNSALASHHYGEGRIIAAIYHLNVLYSFLDSAHLGYDRIIVEIWFSCQGTVIFGSNSKSARRTYEMYDDYINEGDILPQKHWRHGLTKYDILPEWCKEKLGAFLEKKRNERWEKSTIQMMEICAATFCHYIVNAGITSFSDITPEIIKQFNISDQGHKTPEAKSAYNGRIRKFLQYLELEKILPSGIHLSLPHMAASGERIIEVLDKESLKAFERYRADASTPLQLRDVAIIQCALDLGFRACDIVDMRLPNIRWKDSFVRTIQDKTDAEHWVPMMNRTGNALYRYIKEGRPKIPGEDHVFLSAMAPYGPISNATCRYTLIRIGISTTKFHSIRKTYGSDTLNGGATVEETATALGHTDTNNVHKYTLLDDEKMRLCPLSLEEIGLPLEGRYPHA